MKHKSLKKSSVLLCLLLLVSMTVAVGFSFNRTSAQALTHSEWLEQVTSTDTVQVDGGIHIRDFAQNVKDGKYDILGVSSLTGKITNLIPEYYFYTPGTHQYMGTAWGFVLITEPGYNGHNQNWLMLIDFSVRYQNEHINDEIGNDKPSVEPSTEPRPVESYVKHGMENLLNICLQTVRQPDNSYHIQEVRAQGCDFYITDILAMARLRNENHPNQDDPDYVFETDPGDIIRHGRLSWQGLIVDEAATYDWKPLGRYALTLVAKTLLNDILSAVGTPPLITFLLTEADDIIDAIVEGAADFVKFETPSRTYSAIYESRKNQGELHETDPNRKYSRDIVLRQSKALPESQKLQLRSDYKNNAQNGYVEFETLVDDTRVNSRWK